MAYPNTRKLMESSGLSDSDVREIISTYAEELEAQEPHAVNSIHAGKTVADEFGTED